MFYDGAMEKIEQWPPPDWPEIVITWDTMINSENHKPPAILEWVDNYKGGRYHLHGWKSTEGFAFRFERTEDAVIFALRWSR